MVLVEKLTHNFTVIQYLLFNLAEALVPREQGYLGMVTFPSVKYFFSVSFFFTITESYKFL